MKKIIAGAILCAVFATPTLSDPKSTQFRMIDLGLPGASYSSPWAINDRGQVIGYSFNRFDRQLVRGWIWENGKVTDLGTLGGTQMYPMALNESGQVVGYAILTSGNARAFLWDQGVLIDLGTLGGDSSVALGINARGQVVGVSLNADSEYHGFFWEEGVMTDLGTLGGTWSSADFINDLGEIAGRSSTDQAEHLYFSRRGATIDLGNLDSEILNLYSLDNQGRILAAASSGELSDRAILWQNGAATDLGTLGGQSAIPLAINAGGTVVGLSTPSNSSNVYHAFLWDKGTMTDLDPDGEGISEAFAVNSKQQVVGAIVYFDNDRIQALFWEGGVMTVLPSLGDQSMALGINEHGEIIGFSGTHPEDVHAILWTPR
jgi:probable HAF family extracellular repeat protein